MTDLRERSGPSAAGAAGDPSAPGAVERTRALFRRRRRRLRLLALRPLLLLLALILVVGAAIWAVGFSSLLVAEQVRVQGNALLRPTEILAAAAVPEGDPLARIDLDAVEERVERLDEVREAQAHRAWPDAVVIQVTERVGVATVEQGDGWVRVDATGARFDGSRGPALGLPVLEIAPRAPDDALVEAAGVAAVLPGDLLGQIQRIEVASIDRISLFLGDGRQIVWGSAEESDLKAEVLDALMTTKKGRTVAGEPASVIDVSVPTQPTLRR